MARKTIISDFSVLKGKVSSPKVTPTAVTDNAEIASLKETKVKAKKTSSIHPRVGNIYHIAILSGKEAILSEYFLTTRRKMMKNKTDTATVISISHHRSSDFINM